MNQSKLEVIAWSKARENVCERVTIDVCFTSQDWMKKRREFIKPIVERSYLFLVFLLFPLGKLDDGMSRLSTMYVREAGGTNRNACAK